MLHRGVPPFFISSPLSLPDSPPSSPPPTSVSHLYPDRYFVSSRRRPGNRRLPRVMGRLDFCTPLPSPCDLDPFLLQALPARFAIPESLFLFILHYCHMSRDPLSHPRPNKSAWGEARGYRRSESELNLILGEIRPHHYTYTHRLCSFPPKLRNHRPTVRSEPGQIFLLTPLFLCS